MSSKRVLRLSNLYDQDNGPARPSLFRRLGRLGGRVWAAFMDAIRRLLRFGRPRGGDDVGADSAELMPRPDLTQRLITTWTRYEKEASRQ